MNDKMIDAESEALKAMIIESAEQNIGFRSRRPKRNHGSQ